MVLKKMLLSSAGPPRVNRYRQNQRRKDTGAVRVFGSARTGRKRINSISIRHLLHYGAAPRTHDGFSQRDVILYRLCRRDAFLRQAPPLKESFPNGFRLRNYFPDAAQDFPGVPGRQKMDALRGALSFLPGRRGFRRGHPRRPAPGGRQGCSYPPHT